MQYILIVSQQNTLYSKAAGPGGPRESEYAFPAGEAASGKLVLSAKDKMLLKKLRA